jgi:hypothetical protein
MTVETEVRRILKEDADATTWSFKIDDVLGGESLADVVNLMDAQPRRTSPLILTAAAAGVVSMIGIGSYVVSHRNDAKVVSKAAPTTIAAPVSTLAPPVTAVVPATSQAATTAAPATTVESAPPVVATGTFQGETWEVRRSGDCWLISFGTGSSQTVCGSASRNGGFVGLSVIQNQHRFVVASLGSDVGKVQATYADGRVVEITPVAPGLVLLGVDAADTLVSLNALGKDDETITQVGGQITGDTSVNIAVTNVSGVPGAVAAAADANVNVSTSNGTGTTSTQIIVSGNSVSVSASSSAPASGTASASSSGSVTVSSNGSVSVSSNSSASSGGTSVSVPDISLPDISIPDVSIPDVSIPKVSIPDISIPDISIPDISIPDISIPKR